jgi:plasmid stabilization system protein ParE
VKRRFRLTPEARADLRDILLDIATDRPDAAERLRSEFYEALQRLAQAPGIGHYHKELLDGRYRFWNFYSYVVCYLWQKKPIQIIAVVHGARDLAALLAARAGSD